jgi:hypothetical protein
MASISDAASSIVKNSISPGSAVNASADFGVSSYGKSLDNFTNSTLALNTKVGNWTSETTKSITNLSSSLTESLNAYSASAQNFSKEGLSFVASLTNKAIDGINLSSIGSSFDLSSLGSGQLSKLVNEAGGTISSTIDAVKTITKSVSDTISTGKKAINTTLKSVTEAGKAIIEPVTSTLNTLKNVTDPNNISGLVKSNLSFLPDSITNKIASSASEAVSGINERITSIANTVNGATNFLDGFSSLDKLTRSLNLNYNSITNSSGSAIYNYSGYRGTCSDLASLVSTSTYVCPNSANSIEGYTDYANLKDTFDLLLDNASKNGAASVVNGLLSSCDNAYADTRSSAILINNLNTIVAKGDLATFEAVAMNTEGSTITNSRLNITATIANSSITDSTKALSSINNILSKCKLTSNDLIRSSDSTDKLPIYSAAQITALSNSKTGYINSVVNEDQLKTVLNVYSAYGQ